MHYTLTLRLLFDCRPARSLLKVRERVICVLYYSCAPCTWRVHCSMGAQHTICRSECFTLYLPCVSAAMSCHSS